MTSWPAKFEWKSLTSFPFFFWHSRPEFVPVPCVLSRSIPLEKNLAKQCRPPPLKCWIYTKKANTVDYHLHLFDDNVRNSELECVHTIQSSKSEIGVSCENMNIFFFQNRSVFINLVKQIGRTIYSK